MSRPSCRCCRDSFTRREILQASGSGALLATTGAFLATPLVASEGNTSADVEATRSLLQPVSMSAIRLSPGSVFHARQELHRRGYLAHFDPDRLLFHYRALAGLPQAAGIGAGYKGWESGFLRGHMAGHYLSAASRFGVATGDSSFRKRVEYMVGELSDCQEALGAEGYLAAFPATVFDWVEGKSVDNGGIIVPYYTAHKLMAGLLDAHVLLAVPRALPAVTKMADYLARRCAALSAQQLEQVFRTDGVRNPQNEFGAMSDVLAQLFEVTGEPRHLQAAQVFNREWFVEPLARGEDRLAGLHANSHIAQAIGVARCANLTGDSRQSMAAENFWRLVARDHSFVNGGNSFKEWFDRPGVETGPSIDERKTLPATTAESCNTHNMLKLSAALFARRPDPGYGDYHERALYNHLLATVAPDSGAMTYFMPMRGHFRTFLDGTFCCVGTGIENPPRYGEGIYFQRGRDLWLNQYIPSELAGDSRWALRQEGDVTRGIPLRITIAKAPRGKSTLSLRIPGWIARPAILEVNGKVIDKAISGSKFFPISRRWRPGDVVLLTLPASLRLERAKDDASLVSIFHGPVLLAGELGSENMPADFADKDANLKVAPVDVPDIVSASGDPANWLEAMPGTSLAFKAHGAGAATGIVFRPVYEVQHQRFSVYWRLRDAQEPAG
jgi:DUF1680 family protein